MLNSRTGTMPVGALRLSVCTAMIAVTAVLGACSSSKQAATPEAQWRVNGPPTQLAQTAPPAVIIEDDGIEAQTPPRVRKQAEPDDPTEPWSPNYGTVPARSAVNSNPPPFVIEDVPAWREVADASVH